MNDLKNKALQDIVDYAVKRLTQQYTYCGVAAGENVAFLNSGDDEHPITIEIKETTETEDDNA